MINQITIRQPDDWHLHLRDGAVLKSVLPYTSRVFGRAIIMPNLLPPITSLKEAQAYRKRILSNLPIDVSFTPLMTAYITESLNINELKKGFKEGIFTAAKLYPFNSTTNSSYGVRDIKSIYSLFEEMEKIDMPLLIHGEDSDPNVDIFDREFSFIEKYLKKLVNDFPGLRIVLEHITTKEATEFVISCGENVAATITPHHLHINRNAMFFQGFRSDFYCLPVVKREIHRKALRKAAISGNPSFFLGTDSAPHLRPSKENSCACAGIFNAPYAIESYAEVFDEENALDRLEGFCSEYGAAFYKLPLNKKSITLIKNKQKVPDFIEVFEVDGKKDLIAPFHGGQYLNWSLCKK